MFNHYQQNTNCTPWDIPLPRAGNKTLPICNTFYDGVKYFNSLTKFMDEITNPITREQCSKSCLPNCEETRYSYQLDKAELNLNELCYEKSDTRNVQTIIMIYSNLVY